MIALQNRPILPPAKVDISLLLKPQDEEESPPGPCQAPPPGAAPLLTGPAPSVAPPLTKPGSSGAPKRLQPAHTAESPAKKQSKWSPEEDALIIELRGSGMKWEDISKRLPGRSAISCRLHYQNYLERRSEWDEDKKNKLARLYERFKAEMWSKVAEEMAIPWRAAEAMHWQLGEQEMARRAGVPCDRSPNHPNASGQHVFDSTTKKFYFAHPPRPPTWPRSSASFLEELTAGVPAYAPPVPLPRESTMELDDQR
ncbi:hypothetical protein N7468_009781 [Penicillium chermesinum]|uniref:MYB transcription factor n=1 Tax=Penicillium chermesinum TaxID=63820 RepID=A0A9W9NDC5_9EURO|nr:uncharacterized protein N7468_009781 [Penicillium chermesinum]KAJ5216773.1 hypothetical protein N7468_009781 [Penicillium chermesinum]